MACDRVAKSVVCLSVFVVINVVAFVVVTVIQFNNIYNLEAADADLESGLDSLFTGDEYGSIDNAKELSSSARRVLAKSVLSKRGKRSGLGDIFLDLLKTQETVIEKHCKDTTKICKQGDKGATGPPGDQGPKGSQGSAGIKGVKGYQGPMGPKGEPGIAGEPGTMGTTGVAGPQGIPGAAGEKGATGSKGFLGPKGEPGLPGVKGDKGEAGTNGLPGAPGVRGDQGPKGAKGEIGTSGLMGLKGEPGQKGADIDKLNGGCECLKAPTISGPENEVRNVNYGSSVTMTCNADGVPPPKVSWNTRAQGSTLTINRVTSYDYMTYQCTASNVFGSDTKNVTLSH